MMVLVTGASSSIGRDLCLVPTTAGHPSSPQPVGPTISSPLLPPHQQRRRVIGARRGRRARFSAKGNVVEQAVTKAWDALGRIYVLIVWCSFLSRLAWRGVAFSFCYKLDWLMASYKVYIRKMIDAKKNGSAINMSSFAALNCGKLPRGLAYIASKKGLAMELTAYLLGY